MDEGVYQEALGVDDNSCSCLDLLARIIPKRVDATPLFALLTLWPSMMAAARETSRSACSREVT
ncbi:hypothetical protein X732_31300 [Mesorhizobium sp. L2C066B000]|nr:hypothetical protein X732_31300 [Mesorhizobium sp. L2C066B000]